MRSVNLRFGATLVLLCLSSQTTGCALLAVGAAGGAAAGASASVSASQRGQHHPPMTYAGSVAANVVYVPAKIVFAGVGAMASGVTYVATLGHHEPSSTIWDASVKGNYVMTPSMIEGKTPVHFIGA
jgi:hypothetical protein